MDRAGIKPMDYDPAQDQVQPGFDPAKLTAEERADLKALRGRRLLSCCSLAGLWPVRHQAFESAGGERCS